jgi:peptide/nickel transport system substrate-binding protein
VVNIAPRVDSLEVVDDKTFVMTWSSPFYLFDSIGFHALQPLPTHVLRGIWDERNMDAMLNHSYWRGDYFQVGPYRPVKFEPGVEIVLRAVPDYFLGKPKIDTLTIKQYGDANTLFVAVLAGAIDMTADNALAAEQAVDLKAQWERSGAGTVYIGYGVSRGVFPQFSPGLQAEPAMLDPRVRQALYHAVDRESWTDVLLGGMRQNTSHSLLPPDHPLYEFTRNSLQAYSFDPQRALRGLGELGWRRGGDGMLTHQSDGRHFPVAIAVTEDSEDEGVLLADMWKAIGLDTSIAVTSNAQRANREHRQAYTGVEVTSRGYGDAILTRAQCGESAVAPRFSGSNGGHYCDQRMEQLIEGYTRSLTRADQGRMIGEIARLHAEDLPAMQLYFRFSNPTVVRGLNALANDFAGGIQAGGYYGSYFRNAHLWEWTS